MTLEEAFKKLTPVQQDRLRRRRLNGCDLRFVGGTVRLVKGAVDMGELSVDRAERLLEIAQQMLADASAQP